MERIIEMKITKRQLKQIIKEELEAVLNEAKAPGSQIWDRPGGFKPAWQVVGSDEPSTYGAVADLRRKRTRGEPHLDSGLEPKVIIDRPMAEWGNDFPRAAHAIDKAAATEYYREYHDGTLNMSCEELETKIAELPQIASMTKQMLFGIATEQDCKPEPNT